MAWRIDEQVIRGEIDNRVRGRVTGRLWFAGRDEPVVLDLAGDAWRDLAGRRLVFTNPQPRPGSLEGLAAVQTGDVGDITASRKVKVPDVSMEELLERYRCRQPFPWHWGNSLYLEWYGARNGRIVIESASFELTIDPEATWDMTEAEETAQRSANAGAMGRFMSRLTEALDAADREEEAGADAAATEPDDVEPPPEVALGERDDRPLTEEEAERLQVESDRLTDRVHARMEREGPSADIGRIIEEEIDRVRRERGEPELTPEEIEERQRWIDEMNAAAAELARDPDDPEPFAGEAEEVPDSHPLVARCRELTLRVMEAIETHGWAPESAGPEHPVAELESDLMKAGGKLAGALDRREWPPPLEECATTIVWMKRAVRLMEDATLAAEDCRQDRLVEDGWAAGVINETSALAEEVRGLIEELRVRLQRGFD